MTQHATNPNADLLAEIEAYCQRTGMSASAFGVAAVKDPSFVGDLRAGRDLRLSTLRKVRAMMASDEAAA